MPADPEADTRHGLLALMKPRLLFTASSRESHASTTRNIVERAANGSLYARAMHPNILLNLIEFERRPANPTAARSGDDSRLAAKVLSSRFAIEEPPQGTPL